jgi:AraC-like DNA-binding protein
MDSSFSRSEHEGRQHFVRAGSGTTSHNSVMESIRAPLSPIVRESMLSVRVVRGLVEAVEQAGASAVPLLRAARLEPAQLDSEEACLPRAEVYRLCELAVELTRDPALGLHWAEHLCEKTFNPISHLIAHSSTLRQGLQSLLEFHRLLSHASSFSLHERDGKVTLRSARLTGESLVMQRLAAEMLVTGLYRIIRSFKPGARLDKVSFEYPAPSYQQEYTRVFERAERFDQPFTGIVFDQALMDAVSPHKDEDVHNALRVIAERRILRLTKREPFAARVRDLLVQQQGTAHRMEMESVARSLDMSARSLRRRLVAEGTSYNAVVKEALAIIAKQLLRSRQLTIQETAYEMGFAETSTFHRAFKRWTGMTPNTFREQQRTG